jgi:hypothetical protein
VKWEVPAWEVLVNDRAGWRGGLEVLKANGREWDGYEVRCEWHGPRYYGTKAVSLTDSVGAKTGWSSEDVRQRKWNKSVLDQPNTLQG